MGSAPETSQPPGERTELASFRWEDLNRPRWFDPRALRMVSAGLFVGYVGLVTLRPAAVSPGLLPLRVTVLLLAAAGIVFAHRFTWRTLRLYTLAICLVLSLGVGWANALRGDGWSGLPLTALATFSTLIFLQTGADLLLGASVLVVGHTAILLVHPPAGVPLGTAAPLLAASVGAGTLASLMLLVFRARLAQSIGWWRTACERERRLCEFAEVAASNLGEAHLVDTLAARFLESFGAGLCTIALADARDGRFRVAGVAGADALTAMRLKTTPLPPESAAALMATVTDGRVMVKSDIDPDVVVRRQSALGIAIPSRAAVVLPLTVEDVLAGAVTLVAPEPRAFDPGDVALWQAMARQAGVALANARLLGRVQRALRAKNAFLNTMSHELRSPLHVIAGYADMLREGSPELPPPHLGDRIRANTLDLLHLVENTMNVARLDAGTVSLELDEFAPQDLVAELAEDVRALPEAQHGVPVAWAVGADVPLVRLDRRKCKEIVRNLVSNALKHTERGAISVALEREADHLRIAVQDTGRGIPLAAPRQIFDVFERIEEPSGRPTAGVGLGLYIVKSLVQLMRGDVRVTSRPGAGTCFTVRLPLRLAGADA